MPITSHDVVFHTDSDSKSLIFILPDKVLTAKEGRYGGYILRADALDNLTPQALIQIARVLLAEPEKSLKGLYNSDDVEKNRIPSEVRQVLERLPEELRTLRGVTWLAVEEVVYRYYEVGVEVKKVNERYVVFDVVPKPGASRYTARALRLLWWYRGSRKRPMGEEAEKVLRELKVKYIDNQLVQQMYIVKEGYTSSAISLKIVKEAPEGLARVPVATVEEGKDESKTVTGSERPRAVIVRGFLVISQLPSKALLDAHLPEIFRDVKIGRKEIRLVMGYFYNKLGSLSRKFYCQILPKYAIDAGFGYIVPRDKVPEFLREVDLLKKEYAVYERQLKEFLLHGRVPPEVEANKRAKVDKEYLKIVMDYLRQHGAEERVRRKIESLSIVDRVRINLLPFAIDMSILEEYVDEKVRERVEEELYAMRRQIVEAVRQQLEERAKAIIERLEKYARSQLSKEVIEALRRDYEEIRKMAEEFGVESPTLVKLGELLEMSEEELVKTVAVSTASGRVKALLEEIMEE